jgi:hypothetical protein
LVGLVGRRAKEDIVLQNTRRLSVSSAPSLRVIECRSDKPEKPFAMGYCMLIWGGLIAVSWSGIALIGHIL